MSIFRFAILLLNLAVLVRAETPAAPAKASTSDSSAPAHVAAPAPAPAAPAATTAPAASAGDAAATPAPASAPAATPAPAKKSAKAPRATAAKGPAAVVITVGPNKIKRSQIDTLVDLMIRSKQAQNQAQGQPVGQIDPREKVGLEKMVASNLIGQELLELESKRLNVVAEDHAIDSLLKLFRANFPSDDAFKQALHQAGDTEKNLRDKLARQIKADKLLNGQMTPVTKPALKDIQAFFAQHKASFPLNDSLRACQIVFLTNKDASPQDVAKRKADLEKVRAELALDSADVDMLVTRFVIKARDVSEGPESKDGGDLQRFNPNDFFPEFKKQVTSLRVGQMTPVFRTPLGWHLVLLTEKYDGKFDSYRLQISHEMVSEKASDANKSLKKYLQSLAARYHVNYLEQSYKDSSLAGVYN